MYVSQADVTPLSHAAGTDRVQDSKYIKCIALNPYIYGRGRC
jgi:hypothetical protein